MTREQQYGVLKRHLDEKQWRLYLATEIKRLGDGHIRELSRAARADRGTIRRGLRELEAPARNTDRIRNAGGGRKPITAMDRHLVTDLEHMLDPKGDPMSLVRWTTKSLDHLVDALSKKKHRIGRSALSRVLHGLRFSLKANKKNIEGVSHPDRDLQFRHIKATCDTFEKRGDPIISVDCKKKELIGNFKNNGREWTPKGSDTVVNVYDFKSLADGKAAPYGIYDMLKNTGFVNVGVDHDTAAFAVESIRRWWNTTGSVLYCGKTNILIASDGGGSNGTRNRLWKKELQRFADESGLAITVNHLPPATSKWNKIEHRLFSYISINWRGKPLTSLETIIELISRTTTKEGLVVQAMIDKNLYPTGIKVSDADMRTLNMERDDFHGEWNYTIMPRMGGVIGG